MITENDYYLLRSECRALRSKLNALAEHLNIRFDPKHDYPWLNYTVVNATSEKRMQFVALADELGIDLRNLRYMGKPIREGVDGAA